MNDLLYSVDDVAKKMGIATVKLDSMLEECGIEKRDGFIDKTALEALMVYLHEKEQEQIQVRMGNLAYVVGRYILLIDTNTMMQDTFPLLMERLSPLLQEQNKQLLVLSSAITELKRLQTQKKTAQMAERALKILLIEKKKGTIGIYGDPNEHFYDGQIFSVASAMRIKYDILVITQDKALSEDLVDLNKQRSIKGKSVAVSYLDYEGFLWRYQQKKSISVAQTAPYQGERSTSAIVWKKFELVADQGIRLPIQTVPTSGQSVRVGEQVVKLGEEVASGGEGKIYRLKDGMVAKIYHPNRLTRWQVEKMEVMLGRSFSVQGICWPQAKILDEYGNFVGYSMTQANGVELERCAFDRQAISRYFPDWEKVDMVQLSKTILEKMEMLHRKGVLLGDINPRNILVVSPKEVYFVDCDSYQIDGYPCPVGTQRFTPPELQGAAFSTFLRTPAQESFAIATLLFMILMCGKSPYAQLGGTDMGKAIREMQFPYPCGENHQKKPPVGDWIYLWSHLPRFLKNAFYETFQKDGAHSTEETRFSVIDWKKVTDKYLQLLLTGKLQSRDPQSGQLFPTRLKCIQTEDLEIHCVCTCTQCQEEFEITKGEYKFRMQEKGGRLPELCPVCRQELRIMEGLSSVSGLEEEC